MRTFSVFLTRLQVPEGWELCFSHFALASSTMTVRLWRWNKCFRMNGWMITKPWDWPSSFLSSTT
jgi:hypothetical protein